VHNLPHVAAKDTGTQRVTVEIVILAMIAAFLALRLYSVLGRRAEHGEEPMQSRFDAASANGAVSAAPAAANAPRLPDAAVAGQPRPRDMPPVMPLVERGLRDIMNADRRFDANGFVEGARAAYGMVLEAFWKGDKVQIGHLCEGEVAKSFEAAIDARIAAGQVLDNRLVRINDITLVAASLTGSLARVTVRYVADIAAVTRDGEGHVLAGSLNDAVEVRDVWTYARDIRSTDPDWLLDETDEG